MQNLLAEFPSFFTYWNIIFLLKAMLVTFLLTAIGCLFGFTFGILLAVIRKTETIILLPLRIIILKFLEGYHF